MLKKIGSVICAVCMMLTLCLCCFMPVSAADGSGTLKLVCKANNDIPANMMWWIYRIGSWDGKTITLEDQFADCSVSFGDYSAAALTDAASTLETVALLQKDATAKKMTNANGEITFKDVSDGVYLICAKKYKMGDKTFKPSPSIIVFDSAENPDMTVYTKMTSIRTLDGVFERFQLMKVWENDQAMPVKPTSILVEIYCDYELYDTVELNVDNDWKYSWEVDTSLDWKIIEKDIPKDCTVIYRNDGRRYVCVNTYQGPTSSSTETSVPVSTTTTNQVANDTGTKVSSTKKGPIGGGDDTTVAVTSTTTTTQTTAVTTAKAQVTTTTTNKLPQTGQLWWPVPVMALAGLVLIGVGSRIVINGKKEDN